MAEIPVTMIAHFEIENAEGYRIYEKGFFPILKRFNGEFITYDDNTKIIEGDGQATSRTVMFKFPSEKVAMAWYNDPDYKKLAEHRTANTKMHSLTLVHGLPPRD